jgi:hypothetical protein
VAALVGPLFEECAGIDRWVRSGRLDRRLGGQHFKQMKEKESELRTLVRQSHIQPFRVHLDDGKSYTISHPDFALVADVALVLARGPGQELEASLVICYFDHITRVEAPEKQSKAAA